MTPSLQGIQRSFSSPENFQKQAQVNNVLRQRSYGGKLGSLHLDSSGFSPSVQSHSHRYNESPSSQWCHDTPSSLCKARQSPHLSLVDRHYSPEQHYRGHRGDDFYADRNHDGWGQGHDSRRDSSRGGKWHSS